MKAFKLAMSVALLIPTLSQAQSLKVIDTVTRPEKKEEDKPTQPTSQFHQLGEFKMGRRVVRIRVFTNETVNPSNSNQYIIDANDKSTASPEGKIVQNDPVGRTNQNVTCIGRECAINSADIDKLYSREETAEMAGAVILPQVLLCTAKALEQVKRFADANPNDFDLMQIDEVNLIMTASNTMKPEYFSLHRSDVAAIPKDPALNYGFGLLISSADGSSSCKTVSDANFGAAWIQLVAHAKK